MLNYGKALLRDLFLLEYKILAKLNPKEQRKQSGLASSALQIGHRPNFPHHPKF